MSDVLSVPIALFYVGIDWAAETHYVCIVDDAGRVKSTFPIQHTAHGFAELIRRPGRLGDRADVSVGIERPDGRLVDALLEAGHPVVPVSPNAIKTWRDGEVVSGAKSHAGDALVIAEYLRLRQHKLRIAVPFSDQTKALRTAVRTRTDLVEMRVAATNQLTARLRSAPKGTTSPALPEHAVLAMVTVLTAVNAAIKDLDRTVVTHLGEHPDGEIFTSLPRSGQINAAQMLAEWGDCRGAYDCADAVSALAGLTPVTKESGKHRAVSFR